MKKLKLEIGKKFGRWEVISERTQRINNLTNWVCRCECGVEQFVPLNNLMNGSSTQCRTCGNEDAGVKRRTGYKDISGDYWSQIINNSNKKGIHFDVRIEDAWELYIGQNKCCAISGIPINFSGYPHDSKETNAVLSLIDTEVEFTLDNIQWLDKSIAKMKGKMNNDNFIELIYLITSNVSRKQKEKYDEKR